MSGKKKYTPKSFESSKNKDVSANIYASMIQSNAWNNLTNNARVLYLYMKMQYYGQKTIPNMEQDCFYFHKSLFTKTYLLYKNTSQFYKDRQLLIDNGFIEIVGGSTKTTREKMVYRFSCEWQNI